MRITKRRGIVTALVVVAFMIFVVGLIWAFFYYGVMQPTEQASQSQFPISMYGGSYLTFMDDVAFFWVGILFLLLVAWLWGQSRKRGPYG